MAKAKIYRRPSWLETFMEVATVMAKRSVCLHYQVGAVIFKGQQLLSTGYNGPVRGEAHCTIVGCAKMKDGVKLPAGSVKCRGGHAEHNAIINAANIGVAVKDAEIAITFRPCLDCAKDIINAQITKVYYLFDYDGEEEAIMMLNRAGVGLMKFNTISLMKLGQQPTMRRKE